MVEDTAETLTIIGELVIDTETGEVVEDRREEDDAKLELVEYMQREYRFASEQESEWKQAKQNYGRMLGRQIEVLGVKSVSTGYAKSTAFAGSETRTGVREQVDRAVEFEFLTRSQGDELILASADRLDPKKVEAWADEQFDELDDDEAAKKAVAYLVDTIISVTRRAGHVRTTPARKMAPKVEVVER